MGLCLPASWQVFCPLCVCVCVCVISLCSHGLRLNREAWTGDCRSILWTCHGQRFFILPRIWPLLLLPSFWVCAVTFKHIIISDIYRKQDIGRQQEQFTWWLIYCLFFSWSFIPDCTHLFYIYIYIYTQRKPWNYKLIFISFMCVLQLCSVIYLYISFMMVLG